MVYGESVSLGAIYNGNRFVEPTLGYSVQFPADWEGSLRPAGLDLNGPRGSRSVLTRVEEEAGTNPVRYLSSGYLTNFFNRFGTGVRPRVERFDIGGRDTARARFRGVFNGQDAEVNITVVSYGNGLLRFITITPPGDTRLRRAAESIPRGLTRASARDVQDARRLESIEIYTVRPGDTLQAIAARMVEGPRPEDRLRVLNSLSPRYRPQPGDRLKLIVR
jgi:predicted Zn-dependent protease